MERPPPPELGVFLRPFPDDVVATVVRLRTRVLGIIPCHIATYSGHVNLGFNEGSQLADPEHLLEGTGRLIRHVRIGSPDEADAGWIDRYIDAALVHAGLDRTVGDGGTTIRESGGPKRRPE